MRRFRYGADPLCLVACSAYAVNRFLVPLSWKGPFLRDHFSDLLLIPAALPWVLWLQRRIGTRRHDRHPTWAETLLAFALWSIAAEVIAPSLSDKAIADAADVVAYAAGTIVATLWWYRR